MLDHNVENGTIVIDPCGQLGQPFPGLRIPLRTIVILRRLNSNNKIFHCRLSKDYLSLFILAVGQLINASLLPLLKRIFNQVLEAFA